MLTHRRELERLDGPTRLGTRLCAVLVRPGGRIDCPLRPRSAFQPRPRSGVLGCETHDLAAASGQLLVFRWLASPAAGSFLLASSPPIRPDCSYNSHYTSSRQ